MMISKINIFLALLIYEFWLSGLFVLSDLDTLTLCTFGSYAVGSFIAGATSDLIGRKPLFVVSSILLFAAAVISNFNLWAGFISANLCIGPLNNLTFIFLNENPSISNQKNFVKVILGWVASQLFLGIFFMYIESQQLFLILLMPFTAVYSLGAIMLTQETPSFKVNKSNLKDRTCKEILIPTELKALLGGSLLMFMMQMFYYRTQFTLDRFGISLEINTIIVGCTEAIANISLSGFIRKCKRKRSLVILLAALMILLLCLILVSSPQWQTVIEGVMRFCDSCIMLVLGFYLPELFSVGERGKGTNYVMCVGVFGSALSGKLFTHLHFGYLQLFLGAALLGLLLLPETMKEQQHEIDNEDLTTSLTA